MTNRWRNTGVVAGLIGFAFVLALCATVYGGYVAWSATYVLIVLTIYEGYVLVWPMSSVTVSRSIRCVAADYHQGLALSEAIRVLANEPLEISCRLHRRRGWMAPLLRVTQAFPCEAEHKVLQRTTTYVVSWQRQLTGVTRIDGLQRGVYQWDDVALEVSDALGLIRRQVRVSSPLSVMVLPQLVDVSTWRLSSSRGAQAPSTTKSTYGQRYIDVGLRNGDAFHLRPYVAGDRLSRIHWRASAHAGAWLTKHEEPNQTGSVWIWLDDQRSMNDPAVLEQRLSIAASLLVQLARQHISVRLSLSSELTDDWRSNDKTLPVHHGQLKGLDRIASVSRGHDGPPVGPGEPRLAGFLAACRAEKSCTIVVLCDPDVFALSAGAVAAWRRGGGSITGLPEVGA